MIITALKVLAASLLIFLATFAVRLWLVPDIVPVSISQDSQPLWALETAFLLRAVENIAAAIAIIVIATLFGGLVRRWRRRYDT